MWCELGFLFHMMCAVEVAAAKAKSSEGVRGAAAVQRVVTPSNFQRTFQQVPEAVALGLLDSSNIEGASGAGAKEKDKDKDLTTGAGLDPQQLSQTFCRFLLQQLHREAELEAAATLAASSPTAATAASRRQQSQSRTNLSAAAQDGFSPTSPTSSSASASVSVSAVERMFGFANATTTTFLQSKTVERGAVNKVFSLDLVYPAPGKPSKSPRQTSAGSAAVITADAIAAARAYLPTAGGGTSPNPTSFAAVLWGSLQKESQMR
jgi:hypothetical protein